MRANQTQNLSRRISPTLKHPSIPKVLSLKILNRVRSHAIMMQKVCLQAIYGKDEEATTIIYRG